MWCTMLCTIVHQVQHAVCAVHDVLPHRAQGAGSYICGAQYYIGGARWCARPCTRCMYSMYSFYSFCRNCTYVQFLYICTVLYSFCTYVQFLYISTVSVHMQFLYIGSLGVPEIVL